MPPLKPNLRHHPIPELVRALSIPVVTGMWGQLKKQLS
jgi:hypothetical protein